MSVALPWIARIVRDGGPRGWLKVDTDSKLSHGNSADGPWEGGWPLTLTDAGQGSSQCSGTVNMVGEHYTYDTFGGTLKDPNSQHDRGSGTQHVHDSSGLGTTFMQWTADDGGGGEP